MSKQVLTTYLLLILAILSVIVHNFFYAFFQVEEAVFFNLALLLILGFVVSIVYNFIVYTKRGKPKDLWKLGWLGLFGLLGLIPGFGFGFLGFFGFFGFLGQKK
jgi:hypothetical protein